MNRIMIIALLGALILGGSLPVSAWTETREYIWDGVASWVPSTGGGGSGGSGQVTNLASDSAGNLKVNISSSAITFASSVAVDGENRTLVNLASNSTVMIASIAVGIVLQDVRSIASNANTVFADITSGTAAPFWCMVRNTGTQKIHLDSVAPGDTTDYIGAGEQWGPVFFGTNVPNYKFRANSAGTSTWALTLTK